MTKEEALEMLKVAPRGGKPSKVNPSLTQAQAVDLVEGWLKNKPDGEKIDRIFEKRVYQVARNQREPRY